MFTVKSVWKLLTVLDWPINSLQALHIAAQWKHPLSSVYIYIIYLGLWFRPPWHHFYRLTPLQSPALYSVYLTIRGVSEIISRCTIIESGSLGGWCQRNHFSLCYNNWCVLKYAATVDRTMKRDGEVERGTRGSWKIPYWNYHWSELPRIRITNIRNYHPE